MKVLLVEDQARHAERIVDTISNTDDDLNQQLAERQLHWVPPSDIRTARSLVEAKDLIRSSVSTDTPFDLVLLDLWIPMLEDDPDWDEDANPDTLLGYKILELLRSEEVPYSVPVVILSSAANPEDLTNSSIASSSGLRAFRRLLRERRVTPPDEILPKAEYLFRSPSHLRSKLAKYLVDLTRDELQMLETKLEIPLLNLPRSSGTLRALRQLKACARAFSPDQPRPDVLLLGENGVGKTTYARAFHLLRPECAIGERLGFHHLDLGSMDAAGGSVPSLTLFGASDWAEGGQRSWYLGAFSKVTAYIGQTYAGQILGEEQVRAGRLTAGHYPSENSMVDFEHSGTLFLDEVLNIGPEIQRMLLQAVGYNPGKRFVLTTGLSPRPVRVGPALIFATAHWPQNFGRSDEEWREELPPDRRNWPGLKDYLHRLDQIRVEIPPLRKRRSEIKPILERLVSKRTGRSIPIEPNCEEVLVNELDYKNNVADLERIAAQVRPEDPTVSWHHIRPVFMRERGPTEIRSSLRVRDFAECAKDLDDLIDKGRQMSPTDLASAIGPMAAYQVCLVFLERNNFRATKSLPPDDIIKKAFGQDQDAKRFRLYLGRVLGSKLLNVPRPHGNERFLKDLEEWMDKGTITFASIADKRNAHRQTESQDTTPSFEDNIE